MSLLKPRPEKVHADPNDKRQFLKGVYLNLTTRQEILLSTNAKKIQTIQMITHAQEIEILGIYSQSRLSN